MNKTHTPPYRHTHGPWYQPMRFSPEDGHDLPMGAICAGERGIIVACVQDMTPREWTANGRLIAAAPDLLEALEALYSVQNGCPLPKYEKDWNEAMEATKAAISKARGV